MYIWMQYNEHSKSKFNSRNYFKFTKNQNTKDGFISITGLSLKVKTRQCTHGKVLAPHLWGGFN